MIQIAPGAAARIHWSHAEGPVLHRADGTMRCLTRWERIGLALGLLEISDLR